MSNGGYTAAEPLFRQALAIDKKALGDEHPGDATDLNTLLCCCGRQRKKKRQESWEERRLRSAKQLGSQQPDTD
jgi:hypothetical protein